MCEWNEFDGLFFVYVDLVCDFEEIVELVELVEGDEDFVVEVFDVL